MVHAIKYNITQIMPFKRLFLWNSAQHSERWTWSWSKVCEVWLPFLSLSVMSVWDSALISTQCQMNIIIYVSNLNQQIIPVKGIMFKFLRAGSSDDDSGVHLDRLCDLFSTCDATCELSTVSGENIVVLYLPSLWVNSSQLKQPLCKKHVQGRMELKFERKVLNTEIEKSKL